MIYSKNGENYDESIDDILFSESSGGESSEEEVHSSSDVEGDAEEVPEGNLWIRSSK